MKKNEGGKSHHMVANHRSKVPKKKARLKGKKGKKVAGKANQRGRRG